MAVRPSLMASSKSSPNDWNLGGRTQDEDEDGVEKFFGREKRQLGFLKVPAGMKGTSVEKSGHTCNVVMLKH